MSTAAADTSLPASGAAVTVTWPSESLTALRGILAEAFLPHELDLLIADSGEDPNRIGGADKGIDYRALEVVDFFNRRGKLEALIKGARAARPLAQWDRVTSVPAPTPAGATASAAALGEGLRLGVEALTEMIRTDPRALASASKFQTEFELTTQQIGTVGDYKALHDQLHKLDIQCYKLIWRDADRFPADDRVRTDMVIHADMLESAIGDLREIAARPSLKPADTKWLPDLDKALALLRQAIEADSQEALASSIGVLSRILRREPANVNQRLHAVASTLRLDQFLSAVSDLYDTLVDLRLNPDQLQKLAAGVEALKRLTEELPRRVEEHDQWQRLDNELAAVERDAQRALTEDKERWHDLRKLSEPLFAGSAEAWATTFKARVEQLDAAVAAGDPAKVSSTFLSFRSSADNRFYRVDDELHKLCVSLRGSGEPMQIMIALLKGESNG